MPYQVSMMGWVGLGPEIFCWVLKKWPMTNSVTPGSSMQRCGNQLVTCMMMTSNPLVVIVYHRRTHYCYYSYLYPRYQGSRGFGKKLEENCRSDHYSGQSSNTKESCSSTPLNRCTSTETRWNKKAVSRSSPELWLIFFARSEKKVRGRLINWAESLDRNWLKKAVCYKTRMFFLLS